MSIAVIPRTDLTRLGRSAAASLGVSELLDDDAAARYGAEVAEAMRRRRPLPPPPAAAAPRHRAAVTAGPPLPPETADPRPLTLARPPRRLGRRGERAGAVPLRALLALAVAPGVIQ